MKKGKESSIIKKVVLTWPKHYKSLGGTQGALITL